jgi:opacity protein-like surface antigen
MRTRLLPALALAALFTYPTPAHADATVFLSVTPTTESRPGWGVALGGGFLIVGFEFEYARASEDSDAAAPSITTGTGSVYVQTPTPGIQFYAAIGAGLYRERLTDGRGGELHQETSGTTSIGGGAKFGLAGPLRLRLDYRFFTLAGDPISDNPHRIYAGVNLAF